SGMIRFENDTDSEEINIGIINNNFKLLLLSGINLYKQKIEINDCIKGRENKPKNPNFSNVKKLNSW
ncbi:hypothetical protein AB4113_19510, partial [Vibrio breoganii]